MNPDKALHRAKSMLLKRFQEAGVQASVGLTERRSGQALFVRPVSQRDVLDITEYEGFEVVWGDPSGEVELR